MNKQQRRKALEKMLEQLNNIWITVENLRMEEQDAYDALPECPEQAPLEAQMLSEIHGLIDVYEAVESAVESVRDLIDDAAAE